MNRRVNRDESIASRRAESAAFDGTALDWQPGAEGLVGEAQAFMESMWWASTFGPRRCGIEPAQRPSQLTSWTFSISGGVIEIRFTDQARRYEVFRQLAIAATLITRRGTKSLGPEWRSFYVRMIEAAYGADWANRLAYEFTAGGLEFDR